MTDRFCAMACEMPHDLRIVSYLAPNQFKFYEAIASYLGRIFHRTVHIHQSSFDPLDDPLLRQDQIDLALICGLPLTRYNRTALANRAGLTPLQALVAPVMDDDRYGNRPIYFSDVIVHAASPVQTFAQLAGKTFCYNDLGSNSGYNLMRDRLMQAEYSAQFFGQVIQSGSHQRSIQCIIEGKADCAAIDSTVLEQEQRQPNQLSQVRILESLGPHPMPPIAASQRLGSAFLHQLQSALLYPDASLQHPMQSAGIRRFAAVQSSDYAGILQLYDKTLQAGYAVIGVA
jgi:phosphonate transport system substrate-binding protein